MLPTGSFLPIAALRHREVLIEVARARRAQNGRGRRLFRSLDGGGRAGRPRRLGRDGRADWAASPLELTDRGRSGPIASTTRSTTW